MPGGLTKKVPRCLGSDWTFFGAHAVAETRRQVNETSRSLDFGHTGLFVIVIDADMEEVGWR
jgi:hypothetical protein